MSDFGYWNDIPDTRAMPVDGSYVDKAAEDRRKRGEDVQRRMREAREYEERMIEEARRRGE